MSGVTRSIIAFLLLASSGDYCSARFGPGGPLLARGAPRRDRRGAHRDREDSIDFASYALTDPIVIGALNAADHRGVVIRIVLDPRERHDFVNSATFPTTCGSSAAGRSCT